MLWWWWLVVAGSTGASERIVLLKVEESVGALVAAAGADAGLARTLAVVGVTHSEGRHRSGNVAIAV